MTSPRTDDHTSDAEIPNDAVAEKDSNLSTRNEASVGIVDEATTAQHPDCGDALSTELSAKRDASARRGTRAWFVGVGVLPVVALLITGASGYLRWLDSSADMADLARSQSVAAASEAAVAMLSYHPDTVERDLDTARVHLAGPFRDSYDALVHDVVIPGARERHISSEATVTAAGCITATDKDATVLLFINQAVTVGSEAPTTTASAVTTTVHKIGEKWLITGFDPI